MFLRCIIFMLCMLLYLICLVIARCVGLEKLACVWCVYIILRLIFICSIIVLDCWFIWFNICLKIFILCVMLLLYWCMLWWIIFVWLGFSEKRWDFFREELIKRCIIYWCVMMSIDEMFLVYWVMILLFYGLFVLFVRKVLGVLWKWFSRWIRSRSARRIY